MIVGVMGTALISPLYGQYKQLWQLQASDISLIYVIYMGGALFGLLFLGRMPDRIGFLKVMQAGLALALLGTLLCMLAGNMSMLSIGRFIVGVSSSMLTTSSLSGMAALSRHSNAQRTATISGFLMAFGFGLGPLVGGIFGQWIAAPLVTAYVPTLVLLVVALLAMFQLPLPAGIRPLDRPALHWQEFLPRLTGAAPEDKSAFVLVCCLPLLAFAVFGLYAAMSPLFLDKLVPWHGPVVAGSAIATILFASACVQVLAARLPTHWCGFGGLVGLAASNTVLILNLWKGSAALFGLGVALTAMGHGMSMLSGISMVGRIARPGQQSGLLSTYLVVGYIGSMLPMMGIGWIADHWGMNTAVRLFCALVIVIGLVAAVLFHRHPRMRGGSA